MTNSAPTTEEREQFEESMLGGCEHLKLDDGTYVQTDVQRLWLCWQAARRTAPDVRAMALTDSEYRALQWALDAAQRLGKECMWGHVATLRALAAKKDET